MKTDKEFALDLVGWLERYTLRISILEHLLNHSGLKDWREKAATWLQTRFLAQGSIKTSPYGAIPF
jgi:hypothetical protein